MTVVSSGTALDGANKYSNEITSNDGVARGCSCLVEERIDDLVYNVMTLITANRHRPARRKILRSMNDCLKQDVDEADFVLALSLYIDLLVTCWSGARESGLSRAFLTTSARSVDQSRPNFLVGMAHYPRLHLSCEEQRVDPPFSGLTYLVVRASLF